MNTPNHSNDHTETEIKVKVDDLAEVERRILAAGGMLTAGRVYERNVRYEDVAESFTPSMRVLRLRQDTQVRLTYKEPHPQGLEDSGMTRTEMEIVVSDFEMTDLILQKLGFHAAWIYEKYRTTYRMGDCQIVLDELPIGHYIEIEGNAACIDATLAQIGLADAQRITSSYSDLFFQAKALLGLDYRDMTFDNFAEV